MNDAKEGERELKRIKLKQDELNDFKATFSTDSGRRTLMVLMRDYGLASAFDNDPARMAYKNGKRDLVIQMASTTFKPDTFAGQINQLLEAIEQHNQEQE